MDKLDALMQLPMFEAVDSSALVPLTSHFIRKGFERGEYLWKEGQVAHNFTFVVEGRVKISKYRTDGRETILGVFDEGDSVGQIAVYRRMKYPASAIALDETLVLEIYRDHFFGTIRRNDDLLEGVINGMMERNHHLVQRIHELSTSSAEQRLAMLFQKFARKTGLRQKQDDGSMGVYVDLPLSRQDIAELINVRVETAIRIMSRWNKEGPVRTLDSGFLITDQERLDALATNT